MECVIHRREGVCMYLCFKYPEIWAIDALDPMVGPEGGESVADVAVRVSEAIVKMEAQVQGFVLLFTHLLKSAHVSFKP